MTKKACNYNPIRAHRGGDARNFHAHIMVSDRLINAEGFSPAKDRQWTTRKEQAAMEKKALLHMKERWAELGARQLERAGFKAEAERWRHGYKTLAEQRKAALARGDTEFAAACEREPGKHLGVTATAMERKGIKTDRGDRLRAIDARNRERAGVEKELNQIERQITALESQDKTTFRDELGAAFAQQRDEKAEARLAGWQARTVDREIHRDAAIVDREADKLASTADRTVKKAMHGLSDALGGIGKVAERAMEMLSDLISPPPPMTHDQAERAERSAEEKHDEAAVADEAAAKEARLQELLAQMARDDAERRRQREERGGRDDDDDRGRERERER
jgi:MobA/MobL family